MLAEPFSPTLDESVSLILFVVKFIAYLFSLPNKHVIIDLHAFSIKENMGQPIRKPSWTVHLMEKSLMELALALKILEEDDLEEMGFKENVDDSWTHLDNC